MEAGVVKGAANYRWSSYRAFVGEGEAPAWLCLQPTLGLFGTRHARRRYRAFVEAGVDEELGIYWGQVAHCALANLEQDLPKPLATANGLQKRVTIFPNINDNCDLTRVFFMPNCSSIQHPTAEHQLVFKARHDLTRPPIPGRNLKLHPTDTFHPPSS